MAFTYQQNESEIVDYGIDVSGLISHGDTLTGPFAVINPDGLTVTAIQANVAKEVIDGIFAEIGTALLFRATGGTVGNPHVLTFSFNTDKGSFRYTSPVTVTVIADPS